MANRAMSIPLNRKNPILSDGAGFEAWPLGQHANPVEESRLNLDGSRDADTLAILRRDNPAAHAIGLAHAAQFLAGDPNRAHARHARIRLAHESNGGVGGTNDISGQVQHGGSPIRGAGTLPPPHESRYGIPLGDASGIFCLHASALQGIKNQRQRKEPESWPPSPASPPPSAPTSWPRSRAASLADRAKRIIAGISSPSRKAAQWSRKISCASANRATRLKALSMSSSKRSLSPFRSTPPTARRWRRSRRIGLTGRATARRLAAMSS